MFLRLYGMINIPENTIRVFMMHNCKDIESWEDKASNT